MSFRRALIVALCACAVAAAACGGGSDTGDAPDDESIPTATLPAELPEPMIISGGIVQPGGGQSYTVKSGDTMASIAESLGVSLEDLMAANPGVDPSTLHAGDTLKLPSGTDAPSVTPAPAPTEEAAPPATEEPAPTEPAPTEPVATNTPTSLGQSYVVQSGDIPETIAAQFGITTQALLEANPGVNPNNLQVGQVLVIPPAQGAGAAGLADRSRDAFCEPESRGAFGRKPVERNQHDWRSGMREPAGQVRLDGAARGDAPALVQPPAVIGHDDDLHRARHAAFPRQHGERLARIDPPVIERAAGDGALELAALGRGAARCRDRGEPARSDDWDRHGLGQRDGRLPVDARQHAVAVDVGIDDRRDAGILEGAGELDASMSDVSAQPSTATFPPRASMPTATCPGCARPPRHQLRVAQRRRPEDHAGNALFEP